MSDVEEQHTGCEETQAEGPAARADAVAGVLWAAWDAGLGTVGVLASPLAGTHGNREFLVHLRPRAVGGDGGTQTSNPTEYLQAVNRLAGAT